MIRVEIPEIEMEKLATIERLLKMGLSNSEVAQGVEVDAEVVLKIKKEMDNNDLANQKHRT